VYGGQDAKVVARLLSRRGNELRQLPVAPMKDKDNVYQVDLPLSVSLRDDYVVAIEATRGTESVKALVPFRVQ
jgi:hypothetical protein